MNFARLRLAARTPAVAGVLAGVLVATVGCGSFKRLAYEGFDRDSWQHPEEVVEALGLRPGNRVADVGAGGGYFTFRLADAVGPEGVVYAADVDADMTRYLEERAAEEGRDNVRVILGQFEDPLLPDGEVDLLFTSNTYHHLQQRADYFRRIQTDLAPGGRVAILEYREHGWFSRWFGHNTEKQTILDEMTAAGYTLDRDLDLVDRQSFLIFSVE